MRPSVWFVVPAHGRVELARVCLRQLARTCDELRGRGVDADAVVIADDENLDTAAALGFGTVERDNRALGAKWNDGYELAGRTGVDYVIPFGSDDWISADLVERQILEQDGDMRCSRTSAIVADGRRLTRLWIPYMGGDGVKVIPTLLLAACGYRPAREDATRALDASLMMEVTVALGRQPRFSYLDLHPAQIVDWKSADEQLNSYDACQAYRQGDEIIDAVGYLAAWYPAEALTEIAVHYGCVEALA